MMLALLDIIIGKFIIITIIIFIIVIFIIFIVIGFLTKYLIFESFSKHN